MLGLSLMSGRVILLYNSSFKQKWGGVSSTHTFIVERFGWMVCRKEGLLGGLIFGLMGGGTEGRQDAEFDEWVDGLEDG